MSLKIGSNNIGDVYVGGSKISSIFVGNNKVYSSAPPPVIRDFIVNVTRETRDTYVNSSTTYTGDSYVAVKIATGTESGVTRTATVTYGGITQTVNDVPENSPTTIRFGKYKGVDDNTPVTGDMTISGDYSYVEFGVSEPIAKNSNTRVNCVNNIVQYFGSQLTNACYMSGQKRLVEFITPDFLTDARLDFTGCSNLSNLILSPIQTVAPVLSNCTNITSITLPNTITIIPANAFTGSGLTTLTIPKACNYIGGLAFSSSSNTNLTSVYYDGVLEDWCNIEFSSSSSSPLYSTDNVYLKNNLGNYIRVDSITNLSIPNTVNKNMFYSFYKWAIESVYIPGNVASYLRREVFYKCANLRSVTFGEGGQLERIYYGTFHDCTSLTSISIPSSVTIIEDVAFSGCTSLTSFVIPNTITTIGAYAFNGCTSLLEITIPSSVTSIGSKVSSYSNVTGKTFAGCSSLAQCFFAIQTIANLTIATGDFLNQSANVEYYFKDTEANVTAWGKFTTDNFTNTTYHSY